MRRDPQWGRRKVDPRGRDAEATHGRCRADVTLALLHNIMRQGRWKNERVAQSYIRPATIFVNNATDGLGDEPEKKR